MTLRKAALLFCLLFATAASAEGEINVRAYLQPDGPVYVGQQVRLFIEVTTDTWFTEAPAYREIRIEGAVVLEPERFASNITRQVGGRSLNGQQKGFLVYPQRAGELTVPPLPVTLAVAVDGSSGPLTTVMTEPVTTTVQVPEGIDDLASLTTTTRLTVTETWETPEGNAATGDAITRTITRTADNAQALLLPPINFGVVDGTTAYPAQPILSNTANRGTYRGTRTDSVTYLLTSSGSVTFPAVTVRWWNPLTERLTEEELPEKIIEVARGQAYGGETAAETEATGASLSEWIISYGRVVLLIALAVWLAAQLFRRLFPLSVAWLSASEARREASEAERFKTLLAKVAGESEQAVNQAFWHWAESAAATTDKRFRLELLCASEPVWQAWNAACFGNQQSPDRSQLKTALEGIRTALTRESPPGTDRILLNPR